MNQNYDDENNRASIVGGVKDPEDS